MDSDITSYIEQIHAAPARIVFEFAGAGSLALAWLHAVAGSSRTVIEASDRYAPEAMADLLGAPPRKFVSQETAEAMAGAAYQRAVRLGGDPQAVAGVALTAAIATDRVRRGEHSCWVAVRDAQRVRSYGLALRKGARTRQQEEELASRLAVLAIGAACGVVGALPLGLEEDEDLSTAAAPSPDPVAQVIAGEAQAVLVDTDGAREADPDFHGALLSGSFNPLHHGHEQLALAAGRWLRLPVAFELPIVNADKPALSYAELERRLGQFRWRYPVLLSRAPLFVQKAAIFPSCVFVIGYDTAARLIDPRYYGGDAARDAALADIASFGCRFLVAGRAARDGAFQSLDDLPLPEAAAGLFLDLPESAFRVDLSSTEIRERMGGR